MPKQNVAVFSNTYGTTKRIQVDFVGDILASSFDPTPDAGSTEYYFKFSTSAKDTGGNSLPVNVVKQLDNLALNQIKQSATDTLAAYTDVHTMIVDYLYDYIYGHTENQFSSGASLQNAIRFSS